MTTLIEAAQDVVTICKMYRTSLPFDVLAELKNLEQAIAQEQKPSPTWKPEPITAEQEAEDEFFHPNAD